MSFKSILNELKSIFIHFLSIKIHSIPTRDVRTNLTCGKPKTPTLRRSIPLTAVSTRIRPRAAATTPIPTGDPSKCGFQWNQPKFTKCEICFVRVTLIKVRQSQLRNPKSLFGIFYSISVEAVAVETCSSTKENCKSCALESDKPFPVSSWVTFDCDGKQAEYVKVFMEKHPWSVGKWKSTDTLFAK